MKRFGVISLSVLAIAAIVSSGAFVVWNQPPPPMSVSSGAVAVELAEDQTFREELTTKADAPAEPAKTIKMSLSPDLVDEFPSYVVVQDGNTSHKLERTGEFIRTMKILFFPIQIYSIASYIEKPENAATAELLDGMLEDGKRKVYLLRLLKTVPGQAITKAMEEEIVLSFGDVDRTSIQDAIDKFTSQFASGAKKGDIVYMAWLPGARLYSGFNAPENVELVDDKIILTRAIWRIWAGEFAGPERTGLVKRIATDAVGEDAAGQQAAHSTESSPR